MVLKDTQRFTDLPPGFAPDVVSYNQPMPTKTNTHGGRREGSGRKRIDQAEPTAVFPVRMPESLRDKLLELGGGEWIREKIRRAKVK